MVAPLPSDSDLVPLFGWRDLALAAGFAGTTLVLFKVDQHVATQMQTQVTQANVWLKSVAKPSELLASPGVAIIGGSLYVVGRVTRHRRVADLGLHGAESALLANGVTLLLKGLLGRARPFVSSDTNPHDFNFGKGFGSDRRSSFPSGHTTVAFAAAAAATSEVRTQWPNAWWSAWLAPATLYAGATVVGVSRMYHNKHWASDVALGAAIGTFSGIKVVRYTHTHPKNLFDRLLLSTTVVPQRNGALLVWSLAAP